MSEREFDVFLQEQAAVLREDNLAEFDSADRGKVPRSLKKRIRALIRQRHGGQSAGTQLSRRRVPGRKVLFAVIFLAVVLALTLSVGAVRAVIRRYAVERDAPGISIRSTEESGTISSLDHKREPQSLPDGYQRFRESGDMSTYRVFYEKNGRIALTYSQLAAFTRAELSGDAEVTDVAVGSGEGSLFAYADGRLLLFWEDGDFFILASESGELSAEELIEIAESVR